MSPRYAVLNKEVGQTPLQAIEAWRALNPLLASLPASYAGRLDPMASGKLLILLGDECRKQDTYRGLDKEYEIEVLFGFGTDTGDALGVPLYEPSGNHIDSKHIEVAFAAETGTQNVPYPAFSSKTVAGKPLFQYALEGTLGSIQIPMHAETIYRIEHTGTERIPKNALQERLGALLARAPRAPEVSKALGADFRQNQVRAAWDELLAHIPGQEFSVLRLRVTCASGTYMRTLAERLGSHLGTKGMALSIKRTKIGRYHRLPFFGFWSKLYR